MTVMKMYNEDKRRETWENLTYLRKHRVVNELISKGDKMLELRLKEGTFYEEMRNVLEELSKIIIKLKYDSVGAIDRGYIPALDFYRYDKKKKVIYAHLNKYFIKFIQSDREYKEFR